MERLPNRGTVRKLSRRNFLKLATAGVAVGVVTGGIETDLDQITEILKPIVTAAFGPLTTHLREEENRQKISTKEEIKRKWAVRDNLITLKVGDMTYKYYGSNFKRNGNQIFFKQDGPYGHAFKIETDGINGPYSSVEFAFENPEICSIEVKDAKNDRFDIDPKLLFTEPYLTSYEFYQGSTPDYYDGLITIFTKQGDFIEPKLYTREPSTIEGPHFYPPKRDLFDVWTVANIGNILKLGQRTSLRYSGNAFSIVLGKDQGVETVAYLYESFFLKI